MGPKDYQEFLDELTTTLRSDRAVLGFITLGTTADAANRDTFSDHDFWIITESGIEPRYLDAYTWLPMSDKILLTVRHGSSGRSVLFTNGHKVEYLVFDREKAVTGKIERFAVLIDRGGITELAATIRRQTFDGRDASLNRPDKFESLCMLLWSANGLGRRGELLSARRYIHLAIDVLLDLLILNGVLTPVSDKLDPKRRIEQRHPQLAARLEKISLDTITHAALALIEILKLELHESKPNLPWKKLDTIGNWIRNNTPP